MHDPLAHIRAELLAQPESERADYALDLVAFYLNPVPAFFDGCLALKMKLPLPHLRVLYALDRRRGKFVSLDALLAAHCLDRPVDEWHGNERVIKTVYETRKRLARIQLPVEITNYRGIGYILTAPASFKFETAAANQTRWPA